MIRFGASGFSYDDWVGVVYPADLPKWKWLAFYAQEFDTVELNVTYYRIPEPKTVSGWVERTPEGFTFSVKAHQSLTHERGSPEFEAYRESLAPLLQAGKLACVLAQFPHSFHPTAENQAYLGRLREGLAELPTVVELRDRRWLDEGAFDLLKDLGFGFCCVDEPDLPGLMPPIVRTTSPLAYVRFHGRNAQKWWEHEQAWERYDYTYSEPELREWMPRLRQLEEESDLVLVYANNHYRGQSVDTLRKLQAMIRDGGVNQGN